MSEKINMNLTTSSIEELEAEAVKSKIIEAALESIKKQRVSPKSFGLSFGLNT